VRGESVAVVQVWQGPLLDIIFTDGREQVEQLPLLIVGEFLVSIPDRRSTSLTADSTPKGHCRFFLPAAVFFLFVPAAYRA
jgi:hypothetical protein